MNLFDNNLLVGCSFSDYCGFGQGSIGYHGDSRCWYNIVAKHFDIDIDNYSYGGLSNLEILHRVNTHRLNQSYSLIIVQLTNPKRKWFWRDDESEQFMIFNGGSVCNERDVQEKKTVEYIGMNLFNTAREVERDLINLLTLQKSCRENNQRLLIIDAMYFMRASQKFFPELVDQIDKEWLLGCPDSWIATQNDFADDALHPGEKSNQMYAKQVIDHLEKFSTEESL